ncbi:MAG: histidinol dehydrogenase, partial [Lachnospiraceae bacterium]|nr:histidinol dehydrogenase [Lachnospiraceae bacterium]
MRIQRLTPETKGTLLENLLKRSPSSYTQYEKTVSEIIENVRENGDAAIFDYTKRFDGADIDEGNILVTDA